jgi:hypothetical protein
MTVSESAEFISLLVNVFRNIFLSVSAIFQLFISAEGCRCENGSSQGIGISILELSPK